MRGIFFVAVGRLKAPSRIWCYYTRASVDADIFMGIVGGLSLRRLCPDFLCYS